ncbi:hypothetical protein D3C75_887900 [compost metagenome]
MIKMAVSQHNCRRRFAEPIPAGLQDTPREIAKSGVDQNIACCRVADKGNIHKQSPKTGYTLCCLPCISQAGGQYPIQFHLRTSCIVLKFNVLSSCSMAFLCKYKYD